MVDFSIIPFIVKYTDSLWAVLFVVLFVWVLKSNDSREKRYLNVIDQLTDTINHRIADLAEQVEKDTVRNRKG